MRILEGSGGSATLAASLMKAAVFPSNVNTSVVSDYESAAQRPLAKASIFRCDGTTAPDGAFTLRNYCSTAKIAGVLPQRVMMDGFFQGLTNATAPTNIWYWNFVTNVVDGANSQAVVCSITMIYYTELFDLVDLAST